jgi:hypothetical protein
MASFEENTIRRTRALCSQKNCLQEEAESRPAVDPLPYSASLGATSMRHHTDAIWRPGEFYKSLSPCAIAFLSRQAFLEFVARYPLAAHSVARQLRMDFRRVCEQLRNLGLQPSASAKLAQLLLEWCADGHQTERGIRTLCSLAHEEIGGFIGIFRETVSRTLTSLRLCKLIEQCGSALFIPNLRALEVLARQHGC